MADNYFKTPTDPEGFGVSLPERNFRSIDFTALEFDTLMRAITEYVRTYYRDEFNDFVANNGFIMIAEIVCYVGQVLAQRLDILSNEAFLPTSQSEAAVVNHLNLIGQKLTRQTPATVQIVCSLGSPVSTDVHIPAGTTFNLTGPDNETLVYELFAAPYDWDSDIIIPAEKFATIGWAIEGNFQSTFTTTLVGGADQSVVITNTNILDEPILIDIGGIRWRRVEFLEQYGPNDKIYKINIVDDQMTVSFGDDINGKSPLAGQNINIRYRSGGGSRGRIGTGIINTTTNISPEPPVTAPVPVLFRNISPSSGGYPVYGGVSKAVATVFTEINANVVKVYVLAEGENGNPVKPSTGLKSGLRNELNKYNVLTDDVEVEDGDIFAIDIDIAVVMYKNSDAGSIKEEVDEAVDSFFSLSKWNMGQPFYISALYDQIMSINGVKFVNIFEPTDDVLPESDVGNSTTPTVSFNELITLGNKNIKLYYEK